MKKQKITIEIELPDDAPEYEEHAVSWIKGWHIEDAHGSPILCVGPEYARGSDCFTCGIELKKKPQLFLGEIKVYTDPYVDKFNRGELLTPFELRLPDFPTKIGPGLMNDRCLFKTGS